MNNITEFRDYLIKLIQESWKGSRPIGSPSPPFRKGKGHPSVASHVTGIKKFYEGDMLKDKSPGYLKASPEQKLAILKYGSKQYDVFKTGGFKHYVKIADLKTDYKQTKKVTWLNKEIGSSEGKASNRQKKFDEGYKKFKKGDSRTIELKHSDGSIGSLSITDAEKYYKVSILYPRYRAILLKKEMDRYKKRKK